MVCCGNKNCLLNNIFFISPRARSWGTGGAGSKRGERDALRGVRGRGRLPRLFARRPAGQGAAGGAGAPCCADRPGKIICNTGKKNFIIIGISMEYKV
jgi:hypothetical protein